MAETRIADIVVPEVFNPYVVERTNELTNFYLGGAVEIDPLYDIVAQQGGRKVNLPYYKDLSGSDEVLSDSAPLALNPVEADRDVAAILMRGKAWGVNDLAKAVNANRSDPTKVIGDLVAEYWARQQQTAMINILDGVISDNVSNNAGDMVHDISIEDGDNATAGNLFSGDALVDALGTLGDALDSVVGLAVHSTVYQNMQKQQLIDFIPDAQAQIQIPIYMGMRVVVNDQMPEVAGATSGFKYTCYLFGQGAFAQGNGAAPTPVEVERDALAGIDQLVTRRHYIIHPRGIAWQDSSVAGASPTNAELADATNWSRVWNRKSVKIAALITNG